MKKIFREFSKFEIGLWCCSVLGIILSFVLGSERDVLTLIGSLIGVTALIFLAKGNVTGQILTVVFSIFYGVISFGFHYYGEMITYLCMTGPIALISTVTWLKNPSEKGKHEVRIAAVTMRQFVLIVLLTVAVTFVFYYILAYFNTPNLVFSTISIATSFAASSLTVVRSPFYAVAYACNDIVLVVLWLLAAIESISYLPMVMCFLIFLVNDIYGFVNWQRIRRRQKGTAG